MNRRERHRRRAGGMVAMALFASALGITTEMRPSAADEVLGLVRLDAPAGAPSSYCQNNGGQQVIDVTSQGVHTKLYVLVASPSEVDVCYRIATPDGTSEGAKLAITPALPGVDVTGVEVPNVGVPSTDTNSTACSTATANQVPGTHPVSSGGILGVPYSVDTYVGSANGAWVCLQVGATTHSRVVVPAPSPVTGTPNVTVTPSYIVTVSPDA